MTFRLLITATMLLGLMLAGCGTEKNETQSTAQTASVPQPQSIKPVGGEMATSGKIAFQATDIDGELHQSDEWIGRRPVIINVWGTWCGPCRREVPDMVKVYEEFQDQGVEILGLAVRDTPDRVRDYAKSNQMSWVLLMADQNTLKTMGRITGVPTTIFLDKNGNEVERFVGPRSYEVFKQTIKKIL